MHTEHTYTHTCIQINIHIHTRVCIHTHTKIYAPTHPHTHTHKEEENRIHSHKHKCVKTNICSITYIKNMSQNICAHIHTQTHNPQQPQDANDRKMYAYIAYALNSFKIHSQELNICTHIHTNIHKHTHAHTIHTH